MDYKNNPKFTEAFTSEITRLVFYQITDLKDLPVSRRLALEGYMSFADGICTKEFLKNTAHDALRDLKNGNSIVNQSIFWQGILYRCSFPVDEDVALNAAMTVLFAENEPVEYGQAWTAKKVYGIRNDLAALEFFLKFGMSLIPGYKPYLNSIPDNYFQKRKLELSVLNSSMG